MRPLGIFIIILALLAPLYWYAELIAGRDGSAMFSQYLGSVAIIAMAISQMLSTRVIGLESIFGGLDRIYVIHKWLGIIAIAAMLIHDTVDAELKGAETFLTDLGETLGEIGLYGILILVVITVVTFIPYRLWLWTHRFMGAFFVMGALHYYLLMNPLSPTTPLGVYMVIFCALGIISYIYTLLPLRGETGYVISDIMQQGSTVSVILDPEKRRIAHKAGQFAFLRFDIPGFSEVHPFTISKSPDQNGRLRFTIKHLGDYTSQLSKNVKVGARAKVSKAFGHFQRKGRRPEIWIAGGIGITPFLAWASELDNPGKPIDLFYCVRNEAEAVHLEELRSSTRWNNFNLHLIESGKGGRLTGERIAKVVDFDLSAADAYYCGPEPMRKALQNGLTNQGLARSRFHYEEFEIRSGLGLRKLLFWALGLLGLNK